MKKLCLALLLAIVTMSGMPAKAQSNRLNIAIGADSLIYLAAYIAQERGYFKEEGLVSDIKVFRGGVQALAGVMSKDAEVYLGPASTAMKALIAGQDLLVFGNVMDQIQTNIVIQGDVAKKKGVSSSSTMTDRIKALKGLTLGVNAVGSATDQVLRYTLKTNGINPDADVRISPVGAGAALIGSFEQRRIDGFAFSSPASDMAIEKFGGMMVVNYATGEYEPLRGFLYLGLISRRDWLEENPDRAARTLRAFGKALKLIKEKPAEARASLRTFFKDMDEKSFNQGYDANAAAVPAEPRLTARSVELNVDFLEKVEGIKYSKPLDTVYTNKYVDIAYPAKK